jgi:putative permease
MTRRLLRFGAAVMTTLLALGVLWQFRTVLVYVLISLALAAALRPLINRLVGRNFVVRIAWILLYLVILGSFGSLLFLASEATISEIQQLAHTISVQDEWRLPPWLHGSAFQQGLVAGLPPPSKLFEAVAGDQGQRVLLAILGVTQGIGSILSGVFVVLFLGLYWSIDQVHFERLWLSLLPPSQRKQVRDVWRTIELEIGAYIRGQVIQSLLIGLLLGLGYWVLGSPYLMPLALTGALVCLIPLIGVPLALFLPLLVGLLTSVQLGMWTALYTFVVLVTLRIWVKPRLYNRKWDNPIATLVILIALADASGLLGIIIAPPLSIACQILWRRLVRRPAVSESAARVSDLKERQALLWATIEALDEPPLPLVTSSMARLTQLMEKAEPVLQIEKRLERTVLPAEHSSLFHLSHPITVEDELPGFTKL